MPYLRYWIRRACRGLGFDIVRLTGPGTGFNAYADVRTFPKPRPNPVCFGINANHGQSARRFRRVSPSAMIHAFEPSPTSYHRLLRETRGQTRLHLWNLEVGSSSGRMALKENDHSAMSSFLAPSTSAWGSACQQTVVGVTSVDEFAAPR